MSPTHIWKGKRCCIIGRSIMGQMPIVRIKLLDGKVWLVSEVETKSIADRNREIDERRAAKVAQRAEAVRENMKTILKKGIECRVAADFAWHFKDIKPGVDYLRKRIREMIASGEIVFDAENHSLKLNKK